jgi:hypothetical protein
MTGLHWRSAVRAEVSTLTYLGTGSRPNGIAGQFSTPTRAVEFIVPPLLKWIEQAGGSIQVKLKEERKSPIRLSIPSKKSYTLSEISSS